MDLTELGKCVGPNGTDNIDSWTNEAGRIDGQAGRASGIDSRANKANSVGSLAGKATDIDGWANGPMALTALTARPTVGEARGATCKLVNGIIGTMINGVPSGKTLGVCTLRLLSWQSCGSATSQPYRRYW